MEHSEASTPELWIAMLEAPRSKIFRVLAALLMLRAESDGCVNTKVGDNSHQLT